jgi:hypothetical protein
MHIKESPMHVAPVYIGFSERSGHFGSYVHSIFMHFYKRLFSGLEPHELMVTSQVNKNDEG